MWIGAIAAINNDEDEEANLLLVLDFILSRMYFAVVPISRKGTVSPGKMAAPVVIRWIGTSMISPACNIRRRRANSLSVWI